jgi:hypothetical protein
MTKWRLDKLIHRDEYQMVIEQNKRLEADNAGLREQIKFYRKKLLKERLNEEETNASA